MYIVSIDIGLLHLGLIGAFIDESNYKLKEINLCKLVDLKEITEFCAFKDCTLHHEKCFADYMFHFFKIYKEFLEKADVILLEQQPPMGLVCIQEIIRYQYRNKTELVSPHSMHAYFDIGHLNYDQRKEFVIKFAKKWLRNFKAFQRNIRKHDLGDALCILFTYLHHKSSEIAKENLRKTVLKENESYFNFIQTFSFNHSAPKKSDKEIQNKIHK